MMMKQHKWHKEIKAWADGVEIEYAVANSLNYEWHPLDSVNRFEHRNTNFRIKQQPKEPQYLYVYEDSFYSVDEKDTRAGTRIMNIRIKEFEANYIGKIKLEVEDDHGH